MVIADRPGEEKGRHYPDVHRFPSLECSHTARRISASPGRRHAGRAWWREVLLDSGPLFRLSSNSHRGEGSRKDGVLHNRGALSIHLDAVRRVQRSQFVPALDDADARRSTVADVPHLPG